MRPALIPVLFKTFNPLSVFAGGQLGAWYDPSDLSSMFQDSAGTTPAAVDSPVGKLNDKSGNGYHLTQATSSARPVLRLASGLYYLEFDGVDDKLSASGTALDLFKNIAGGALYVGAAVSTVVQLQPGIFGWGTNSGVASRAAILPNSADLQAGGRRLDADSFAAVTKAATLVANTPFVASGLFDFANATLTLRKDRAQVGQSTSFQTAGSTSNTSSTVAGIGAVSAVYAGRFYGGFALQRVPDIITSGNIENYLSAKCGV